MIRNFADKESRALFEGKRVRRWQAIEASAMRKLAMLNRAAKLEDLKIPPANRLEALRGNRTGKYSIRINDQYRICFVWKQGDAFDVEIVDYH
ncbi:type II toxin-antitoxin system RelE/ParE family toxin [Dokdonella sp.]|uniref:type II toxin-antitoxin system RelE/ParE family toxin n=1 Tax=Dokdonella sp. TaxID=2291710 RepID=UPI003784E9B2